MFKTLAQKIIGTRNDRLLKVYQKRVKQINLLEEHYKKLSDDEIKSEFNTLQDKVSKNEKSLDDVLNDVFAIVREVGSRKLNMRHYDVQLIGGMVLNDGCIAEMKTGEGKTLVATLAVVLNAMSKKGVHVVTTNDYLAQRDANEMKAIYEFLGFSVGVLVQGNNALRKEIYACDIVYGTNSEFGFDYLRDNMCFSAEDKMQREHNFVIVDEVDSILIDEARTPLIISGPTNRTLDGYIKANKVAQALQRGVASENPKEKPSGDFVVDEKNRSIILTESGISKAEKLFEVDNLYSMDNAILAHQLDQALKANNLFEKDVHYVLRNNEVMIVDEFTGRVSEGRRFSEGLHQALEAKEGVKIQEESQTLADITYQNYFRMYSKLSGMTGTAQTEASEFSQIYNLEVISIPTNVPVIRKDLDDLIYKTQDEKFKAVVNLITQLHKKGQPVLVGTASIEKSELLHSYLVKAKIPHSVLNAKNHAHEAEIIKDAGKKGAVTIATNMAGRGVDIKISDEIRELGGLYIIGTERHESRRIDNQLRGRSGRQGDPGTSRFYLSLEDNLLRIFGGDRLKAIFTRLKIAEGESIESPLVTRAVANAQKKVENLHFESRKHILEYDDVANEQRKTIYKYRNELLDVNYDISQKVEQNINEYTQSLFEEYQDYNTLSEFLNSEFKIGVDIELLQNMQDNEKLTLLCSSINKFIDDKFKDALENKENIQKFIYLQVLDHVWREHLYQMDILKTGIGLRGYNQKDPLVEYKKESYNLFLELVQRIKIESIKILLMAKIANKEEEQQELKSVEENSSAKKQLRNDLCACGSGKKYKNCCGVSGPKQGIFA
ncbi:preprotein translocase subunit SecA [Campylobacter canadensis]|uniref:preprotein translocase subunit SecA n=1 Tax=Campylobacter canadensis TaxID=449520 RepID=UPI00155612CB|nr:preprotein translocase subunit SecA [Campylobacter canadensis]MBZ7993990.1 preprotein translocase subunit SecA [Campylobacter canadensis]MBZ7996305.1 preprotein translocase subunit SecA [Campylobacter canadensis]MBZ7999321.1 preprotein translocase subunit SecA [Campylobacter canadensis]MBZ8001118.1 preprotein translocase subunit SecA [Campylobacter canadensis]MBZ8003647.1 preprotein translocase subunit SecA [Campylobacter canadensis]